jgi:hypothetical protein
MIESLKDWLPITKRNRVALGVAVLALVMFVSWNFTPTYSYGESTPDGIVAMDLWPAVCSLDIITDVIKSPDIDGFLELAATLALFQNGLVLLIILPFWKMLHASVYIRLPLVLINLAGGAAVFWFVFDNGLELDDLQELFELIALCLIAMSMISLGISMMIFKNELELRHELEVKKTMGGGD